MVAKGDIQTVDFHPNENGGTRILKGIMTVGREGEELSWKLEGMAEVKVSIWALSSRFSHHVQFPSPVPGPSCQAH